MSEHDVLIIGAGIAGLRAAVELSQKADVAVVSKVLPTRSHSGAAQGGITAASGYSRSFHYKEIQKGRGINGKNYAPGPVLIESLPKFPVAKDLVVDMDAFFDKYRSVKPYLIPDEETPVKEHLQSPEQRNKFDEAIRCILCASCGRPVLSQMRMRYFWTRLLFSGHSVICSIPVTGEPNPAEMYWIQRMGSGTARRMASAPKSAPKRSRSRNLWP